MKRIRLFCFLFIAISLVSLPAVPGLSSGISLTSFQVTPEIELQLGAQGFAAVASQTP